MTCAKLCNNLLFVIERIQRQQPALLDDRQHYNTNEACALCTDYRTGDEVFNNNDYQGRQTGGGLGGLNPP